MSRDEVALLLFKPPGEINFKIFSHLYILLCIICCFYIAWPIQQCRLKSQLCAVGGEDPETHRKAAALPWSTDHSSRESRPMITNLVVMAVTIEKVKRKPFILLGPLRGSSVWALKGLSDSEVIIACVEEGTRARAAGIIHVPSRSCLCIPEPRTL